MGVIGDLQDPRPPVDQAPYYTGNAELPPVPDQSVYDMILAAKRYRDLSRRVSAFDPTALPPDPSCLDVLDVLVLSSDRLASDMGGIAVVRDWVLRGGHLWILLDEVQPATVSAIMGDAFATQVVDRVQLSQLEMHNARTDQAYERNETLTFEEPVDLVRVIAGNATVTDTIGTWPAALRQMFGAGQVYFTTVSPRAWMRPTTSQDPPPRVAGEDTPFYPRDPLKCLAMECFVARPPTKLNTAVLQPILTQQIGYQILGRRSVLAILGIFCLVLMAVGGWFYRVGRPERLLWLVPITAALTSLVFVAIGLATKKSVPPTAATLAHVTFQPGVNAAHASGLAAMYNQDSCREKMGATRGGIFFPDMTALTGRRRRMIWTDEGAWHWSDLELPAGVRTAPFDYPMPLDRIVSCQAQFGPQGLQGTLGPLPFQELQDAIIIQPFCNAVGVNVGDDGSFTADSDNALAAGVFMAETWLDDAQQRRQAVYEQLLGSPPESEEIGPPMLYAWSTATKMGFEFPQPHQIGSTLLSLPVRIDKTPPGTNVSLPAPFVSYRAVPGPDGQPPTAYANLMHRWVETRLKATDRLRFQMPPSVLPLKINQARLSLRLRAASRSVKILAFDGNKPVEILALSHPIGSYSVVIDRPALLQLDSGGGLLLAVDVSDDESAKPSDQMAQAPWKVESLQLTVNATVLE